MFYIVLPFNPEKKKNCSFTTKTWWFYYLAIFDHLKSGSFPAAFRCRFYYQASAGPRRSDSNILAVYCYIAVSHLDGPLIDDIDVYAYLYIYISLYK